MRKYSEFIEGLQQDVDVPDEVWTKFEDTLSSLPEEGTFRQQRGKRWIKAAALATAVLALGTGFCYVNPVLAEKIPIIGKIFEYVEEDITFSGSYKEKGSILTEEEQGTDETADASYTVEDQGVEITASEIYCDGYSVFLTARVWVEKGGLLNIPAHYTSRFAGEDETTAQSIYINGDWSLKGFDTMERLDVNIFEGKVLDDNTFIGMLKVDLGEVANQDGMLHLQLTKIGYDDLNDINSKDISETHRTTGCWKFIIPFQVDTENAREIQVDQKTEDGYGIEKVFVSPYQLIIFTELPYKTLSEEEFTREDYEQAWGPKNQEIEVAEEKIMTYEECLNEKIYEPFDLAVFNQDGEVLTPVDSDYEKSVFAVRNLEITSFHVFIGTEIEDFPLVKETDMNAAREKSVLEVKVNTK